ncbi:MAG: S-layer homology domain-containing protein, partial [Sedimentisphaerales bacterium]|nr:S-layer homology domain-containing protein [Sedimentisphaerales bacterium]
GRLQMRKRGCFYKPALVLAGALLLVMLLAPSAFAATDCQTRVQAIDKEVCPYVLAQVPDDASVPLVGGDTFQSEFANPLAALHLTSVERGFSIEVADSGFGAFVNTIAGYGDPVAFTNYWLFAVNGYMSPLGASSVQAQDDDSYLWLNVPSTAPYNNMSLMVSGPATIALGESGSFTVVGDDLGKVNSEADITRFDLDPAETVVQTPAEFAAIAGATVCAGGITQTSDTAGQVTVTATLPGTYAIWAEKAADTTFYYVPSTQAVMFTIPFTDVATENPYFGAIHKIAGMGIVGGYEVAPTQIDFRPQTSLYRAQFAKIVSIALGLDVQEGSTSPFIDLGEQVADNLYPNDYVAAAHAAGVVKGLTESAFGPYADVTRAQVVTMVVRALQSMHSGVLQDPAAEYESTWGDFSADHAENARIAEFNGLLDGLPLETTAANPWASMSRGEAAQLVANMLELLDR